MQVDYDPMNVEEALYMEPFKCMIVETADGLIEVSKATSLAESFKVMMVETTEGFRNEDVRRPESSYPHPGESLSYFQEKCKGNGSKALLCPKCNTVFDEKIAERLEADNKVVKEEKPDVPRFVFDRHGTPQRNEDYRR